MAAFTVAPPLTLELGQGLTHALVLLAAIALTSLYLANMAPDLESGTLGVRLPSVRPRRLGRPVLLFLVSLLLYTAYQHAPPRATHLVPRPHHKPYPGPTFPDDIFDDELDLDDPLEFSNNDNIPPVNPSKNDLADPALYFPQIDINAPLASPVINPFPADHMPWVASTPVEDIPGLEPDVAAEPLWQDEAFAKSWVHPQSDEWKGRAGSKRVQFDFDSAPRETEHEKQIRQARRDAVKRGFIFAWEGYKRHAWGE